MALETNTILIRFGEIFLKGSNRSYFEAALIKNIKSALEGITFRFVKGRGRYVIENFDPSDADDILSRLTKVFGLHSVSPCIKVKTDLALIEQTAAEFSPRSGAFRVTVKRADQRVKEKSTDIAARIGGFMLSKAPDLKVDLFKYDFELNVDIREDGHSYLFYNKIPCVQGLPSGVSGRAVLLLSGGIDSPVAAYKMAKRGLHIEAVHFHSYPYTSELALQKVVDLAKKLKAYIPAIRLTVVPFTEIQYAIHEKCPSEFMITLMRRFMMRIAERLAKEYYCGAIITGESLGQVASQTMDSITVTNSVVSMPVFRPLIGSDKDEIIEVAQKIDTFEISIRPYEDCCTVFLPKNPVIHPSLSEVVKLEERLDIEALIAKAIEEIKVIEIN